MKPLRRFIAGARCPSCGRFDTLALDAEAGARVCECVACGFRDSLDREAGGAADPRNHGLGEGDPEVLPVRILDPHER